MPQTFQVLRCYECAVFQIHPTKKSNKFQCKMCGEKQSIKRHYGIGTGKDCRLHVQRLNCIRGDLIDEMQEQNKSLEDTASDEELTKPSIENVKPTNSKWSEYVNDEENNTENEIEPMYLGDTKEVPKKRSRKIFDGSNYKKKCFNKNTNNVSLNKPSSSSNIEDNMTGTINDYVGDLSYNESHSMTSYKNNNCQVKFVAPILKIKSEDDTRACIKMNESFCNNPIEIIQPNNIKEEKKILKNDFIVPKINTNSKWAQFVDTEEINETDKKEDLNYNSENTFDDDSETKIGSTLFSLCNDADLDDVLHI